MQRSGERRRSNGRFPEDEWERPRRRGGLAVVLIVAVIALLVGGGFAAWYFLVREPDPEPQEEVEERVLTPEDERVERLLADLSLEQKVAQLFVVRPESITGVEAAVAAGEATRLAITEYPVGGLCYFSQNLVSPEQTKEMLRNTQNYSKDACGLPLLMCVDEEGGTVARVANSGVFDVPYVGDMADLGATGDPEQARAAAMTIGTYLRDLGFNVDFAPVADIATSQDGTMAERAFGSTPEEVCPMVAAQVEGFMHQGVLCSAKHFPGIGGAEGDSHNGRIYSSRSEEEMRSWELLPFEAAIDAGVPMVMVGHLSCLGLSSGESDLPASLSPAVIGGLLREGLGFEGLVITDSLEMGAIEESVCPASEQGVRAIEAGADLILLPADFTSAYDTLLQAVRSGRISEERVDESVRRVIHAKVELGA